jgi:hypothetical protein
MTKPSTALFLVTLRHLSADAKKAGAELPNVQLNYLSTKQLRSILQSVADLAPTVAYPAEPEVRVEGPAGKYVIQVKAGRLNLVSWSSTQKYGALTTEQIFAAVTGEEPAEGARQDRVATGKSAPSGIRSKVTMFLLGAAIVGVNCFTLWFITRPPTSLLPKYRLLEPAPAERLLVEVAGTYETGKGPGDRRLEIQKNGEAQRMKYGSEGDVKEKQVFTVAPAEVAGKPSLLTSRKTMISVKDQLSVVLHGDTYVRVQK